MGVSSGRAVWTDIVDDMTVTLIAPTELDKARAFVDAGHLGAATGADMKSALWELNQSNETDDQIRAFAIRNVWNSEHDQFVELSRQVLRIWNWR